MKRTKLLSMGIVVLFACPFLRLEAQEVTVLGGVTNASDFRQSSYAWQVDYRQDFFRNLAASVAYINEGHVPGHHRDGSAIEAWGRLPFAQNRFSVAFGVGAYYYYDTQLDSSGSTVNIHGTAPIFSVAATGYLSDRVLYRFMLNHINPAHEMKTDTAVLGVGYWFGRGEKPTPGRLGDAPEQEGFKTQNEIAVFGGQSVVNTFFSQAARAYAVEYRRGFLPHLDWTASYIYEGNPEIVRRSGIASQVWAVNTFFQDRISVGIGLGPYVFIDRKHPVSSGRANPAAIAPLASLTVSGGLSENWVARVVFHRVTSSYNRDADIFLLGIGRRWRGAEGAGSAD
jgi:hypothetical protein